MIGFAPSYTAIGGRTLIVMLARLIQRLTGVEYTSTTSFLIDGEIPSLIDLILGLVVLLPLVALGLGC